MPANFFRFGVPQKKMGVRGRGWSSKGIYVSGFLRDFLPGYFASTLSVGVPRTYGTVWTGLATIFEEISPKHWTRGRISTILLVWKSPSPSSDSSSPSSETLFSSTGSETASGSALPFTDSGGGDDGNLPLPTVLFHRVRVRLDCHSHARVRLQGRELVSDHLIEVAWYWFAAFITFTAMAVAILRSND